MTKVEEKKRQYRKSRRGKKREGMGKRGHSQSHVKR